MTGHAPVPSEVEAKLLVPRERDLRAIAALKRLGTHPLRARDSARLHSLYVDTVDLTLARQGVALRLRQDRNRWEATAKWAGRVDETLHERPELTVDLSAPPALPFVLPEGPLHTHLAALVAGRPLLPILITDIHRRRVDVLAAGEADGDESLAELALDRVRLRSPQNPTADAAYYEVEIEQLRGQRQQVAELARQLQRQFKLAPSPDSKFARGLKLLYGGAGLVAAEPHVLAGDTVEQAARSVVGRHLRRLREHDPGTRIGEDPEALHDMRVAVRRLRAAVRIFAAGFPVRAEHGLRGELRWLGRLLGGVRDLDVQLEHLAAFAAQAPPNVRAGLLGFDDYLVAERSRRRAPMLAGLDSPRYFRLLVRLEEFAAGRARRGKRSVAQTPVAVIGRRAIKKALRDLLKRGDKIGAAPTPEDLHVLRIRAKRLRYLFEFLIDVVGKEGGRFVKRLTRLQDLLGTYHDAVVAGDYVRLYAERPGVELDAEQWRALMALAVSQSRLAEDMRGRFRQAWERFSKARTVKACRATLRQLKGAPPSNGAVYT